jgi:hypothetical protein
LLTLSSLISLSIHPIFLASFLGKRERRSRSIFSPVKISS